MTHPLDHPVLASLTGAHASMALTKGAAARYLADICPFAALPDQPNAADWADAAGLTEPDEQVAFPGLRDGPPPGWELVWLGTVVQLVAGAGAVGRPPPAGVPRGPADVPEMLSLTERTRPGPFRPRTVEFGGYLGIRRDGELVAMAGERFRPPGWTEISAVCTDPAWRGQGFASRLTRAVAAAVTARGDTPYLHAVSDNTTPIRLYLELGFSYRRDLTFPLLRRAGQRRSTPPEMLQP